MGKFKKRYSYSNKQIYIITVVIIVFLALYFFFLFSSKVSPNMIRIASEKLKKVSYNFINEYYVPDFDENDLNNILNITLNNDNEILFVDYNVEEVYKVLDTATKDIKDAFYKLENGIIDIKSYDTSFEAVNNNIYISMPLLAGTNNFYLANIGPKIPIKVNFISSILTNIKTKVTNYGFNNALLEVMIIIDIEEEIISPNSNETIHIYYESIVAAKVVNGRVPYFYGTDLISESGVFKEVVAS